MFSVLNFSFNNKRPLAGCLYSSFSYIPSLTQSFLTIISSMNVKVNELILHYLNFFILYTRLGDKHASESKTPLSCRFMILSYKKYGVDKKDKT